MDVETYKKIIDLIYSSIISEGGDGDAIWLSKHKSLSEIEELIKNFNLINNINWTLEVREIYIMWGSDQEWCVITCDEDFFNSQPNWITLRIKY